MVHPLSMFRRASIFASALIGILAEISCGKSARAPTSHDGERLPTSNVQRGDYVGSAACASCHAAIAARFTQSPMHTMTRTPTTAAIRAPFDGTVFRFKDDTAKLERVGDDRFVSITSAKFGSKIYRVSRVIGGHHREDFAGVEVVGVRANAQVVGDGHEESILPVSFVYATSSLRYKGYSVMLKERSGLKAGGVWNQTCIFCHNTVPFLSTVLGALAKGAGEQSPGFQGEVVDDRLPAARRFGFEITDEAALGEALRAEEKFLSAEVDDEGAMGKRLVAAVRATKEAFDARHLVELGIGCESCHGGGKEHVGDPRVAMTFEPRAPFLKVTHPETSDDALRAQRINRTCARCHQVLFSGYPWTWEGRARSNDPGGSNINSGEARDFLLGACASAMTCVDCHDPHAPADRSRLDALEGEAGDRVCLKCHGKFGENAARAKHTHHAAGSAGDRCLGCHMPKKNMSLDLATTRYHRIGRPNDPARVEGDRPIECAICHSDETVGALVAQMQTWWPRMLDQGKIAALYGGSLDVDPMTTTLRLGKPHEQAVAMFVLGKAKRTDAAALLAQQLIHPIPILRWYASSALEQILGEPSPVDLHMENDDIATAGKAWLARHGY